MERLKFRTFAVAVTSLVALWSFVQFSYNSKPIRKHYILSNFNVLPKMIYSDISHCPKPHYLPEYKAHCWGECKEGQICRQPVSSEDITAKRAKLKCIGNLNLIGVRKSGTTDIQDWFVKRNDIALRHSDFRMKDGLCPVEYFSDCNNIRICDQKAGLVDLKSIQLQRGYFQSSPGNLMINDKVARNATHIIITTPMQYLGFMATPETRFYVQLRNPTDRAISYLFHWHNKKWQNLFSDMTLQEMDAKFVDGVIKTYLHKLKECILKHGDFYCAYLSDGLDGDLDCLLQHSMYVVYIKEAFKFVPRSQFLFSTTDEYSKSNVKVVRQLTEFFGLQFSEDSFSSETKDERKNVGSKNPVWPSTVKLLDDFYAPYNKELAALLGDSKWLFHAGRDS